MVVLSWVSPQGAVSALPSALSVAYWYYKEGYTMGRNAHNLWLACLGQLELSIPRPSYETWLTGTSGRSFDGARLLVTVPTTFTAEWLERRMLSLIQRTATDVNGSPVEVVFEVLSPSAQQDSYEANSFTPKDSKLNSSVSARPDTNSDARPQVTPFQPHFTFTDFVVGESNQFAHAAACAVAEQPGAQYNPLFIYAGVGLGKTHLLHAIAAAVSERSLKPLYVTSEQFTNDFIYSIRNRNSDSFRVRYRTADVLLIDDIQFLEGKVQTQVGFFHTFNELHSLGKQIVISSDRHPSVVPLLSERLNSRFGSGLVVDIQPPDLETRAAILVHKALTSKISLPSDVARLIAKVSSKSIRELEGNLNRVLALSHFLNQSLTISLVESALNYFSSPPTPGSLTADSVISLVANHYRISPEAVVVRPTDRRTTEPQRVTMFILRSILNLSPVQIGLLLGSWDRRTVSNSIRSVTLLLQSNDSFRSRYDTLTSTLKD